ncbi:MAG: hypothetical protein LBH25_11000 [Fibromonadaceae bacterium]|nr:hypothetical protein [Fibromonadaceae bacterium]
MQQKGTQTWMAENLSYEAEGSRRYGDSTSYYNKYGRLYNPATAKTSLAFLPAGWLQQFRWLFLL